MEVQFRDVNYDAEVLIGSAGLPSVGNTFKNWAMVKLNSLAIQNTSETRPWLWLLTCEHVSLFVQYMCHSRACHSHAAVMQILGKLVGKSAGEKRKMKILKGVTGALKPVGSDFAAPDRTACCSRYSSHHSIHT